MKSLISALFAVFVVCQAFAQESLDFDNPDFDFGTVEELEGPVDHKFTFVNRGLEPVTILRVQASCGCTTPDWSKEPVAPGESGFIMARYDPKNRPGAFRKSLKVTTSIPTLKKTLFIKGTVNPKPRTIADDLPTKMDGIRVQYRSFNFGTIKNHEPIRKSFDVYNDSEETIAFLEDKGASPQFIQVAYEPVSLAPKEKGKIWITYDPSQVAEFGFNSSRISLYTSEEEGKNRKQFNVLSTVVEYFPPMSDEDLAKAPRLAFDKTAHNFGKMAKDAAAETEFLLTNNGRESLNIRLAKSNCGCTVVDLEKEDIKPGETVKMKVKFDSKGRRGRQYKTVTVFSNDPTAPTQVLSLRAEVPRT
ncbi:MAG: DUF1573 domain-containing protein [Cytophagales bacterium]|nr:DUF1573 domain-containing protein [Cytophagales bacterium]